MKKFLIAACLLLPAVSAHAGREELDLRNAMLSDVTHAWQSEDFAQLEHTAEAFASTRARTYSGKSRLELWFDLLEDQMKVDWPNEFREPGVTSECDCGGSPLPSRYAKADELWAPIDAKMQRWEDAFPNSPHAVVAKAAYYVRRAWFYRGSDVAAHVPQEAWWEMHQYERKAWEFLNAHRDARSRNPEWFTLALLVAMDLERPADEIKALRDDFLENGQFYPSTLKLFFSRMQPKWGGSFAEMDRFARYVVDRTRETDGNAMYARLYWTMSAQYRGRVFSELPIDWPMMRTGFEDMIVRFPDPRNVNALGMFACLAGDIPTMERALERLAGDVDPEQWDFVVSFGYCQSLRKTATR